MNMHHAGRNPLDRGPPYCYSNGRSAALKSAKKRRPATYRNIEEYFASISPHCKDKRFELDVDADRISTEPIPEIPGCHNTWIDGASRYYIDGQTVISGRIPVLKYDNATCTYSGPRPQRSQENDMVAAGR